MSTATGPATYTSRDGDTVDYICYKYYGTLTNLQTETVLAANPGLAAYGPVLPTGVVITLPVITVTQQQTRSILG